MPYKYEDHRSAVFTDDGQRMLLKIRDRAFKLIDESGCAMVANIISGSAGDSWHMLACIDRLVEIRELREVEYGPCAGQYKIYVRHF